jgi:predicted nuclease of predicted toxin-antitoxin system
VLKDPQNIKLLIDEDLSPRVAHLLCEQLLIDSISVRDRGLLSSNDPEVLEYAFQEDRILVTANIRDFEQLARSYEIHPGIVLIRDGSLLREEQIIIVKNAIQAIEAELKDGRDMINRVLYISIDGTKKFENLSASSVEKD